MKIYTRVLYPGKQIIYILNLVIILGKLIITLSIPIGSFSLFTKKKKKKKNSASPRIRTAIALAGTVGIAASCGSTENLGELECSPKPNPTADPLISGSSGSASSEGYALYTQRRSLPNPDKVLSRWDPTLVNPCTWFHITCNQDNRLTRLFEINPDLKVHSCWAL